MKYIFLIFMFLTPAMAEDMPKCTAESVGTVQCMASKMCECTYERGGTMTGKPAGYKWDCGLLRPNCVDQHANEPKPYDGPDSVSIDKSTVNVTQ